MSRGCCEIVELVGLKCRIIKAEHDWCDGRPQVAMHRQLSLFLLLSVVILTHNSTVRVCLFSWARVFVYLTRKCILENVIYDLDL